jgi:hypothetical protein
MLVWRFKEWVGEAITHCQQQVADEHESDRSLLP